MRSVLRDPPSAQIGHCPVLARLTLQTEMGIRQDDRSFWRGSRPRIESGNRHGGLRDRPLEQGPSHQSAMRFAAVLAKPML